MMMKKKIMMKIILMKTVMLLWVIKGIISNNSKIAHHLREVGLINLIMPG